MWSLIFHLLLIFNLVLAGRRGGGSHSYPSSTGYSGRSGGSHVYPSSTGYSGNTHVQRASYPASTGMSGNTQVNSHVQQGISRNTHTQVNSHVHQTYHQNNINYGHKTVVHNHYHYSPPQQISYGSTFHPVYHATPPVYVYEYRSSGSRFDTLLAGLALYNLGRMSASPRYSSHQEYRSNPGEICKLGISKPNGDYEESRIDCKLMSSFIWESESQQVNRQVINTVTTTVTRNNTNTVTVQEKTVVDALQVKGPSIQVTQGMTCFMIRISPNSSVLKKNVECGLLQAYAQNSLQYYNGAEKLLSSLTTVLFFVYYFIS